ncbi:hypothetical protein VNO77_17510 [Canavalia gladiata]|uniref:Uncharacterized protein n=1 Tax=Canavalia gladiata TaxID=3824 RepID=A0AAN9LJU9_CANGL
MGWVLGIVIEDRMGVDIVNTLLPSLNMSIPLKEPRMSAMTDTKPRQRQKDTLHDVNYTLLSTSESLTTHTQTTIIC